MVHSQQFSSADDREKELRRIVNAIPGFVWSASADGKVDFVNQRWCEYTGGTVEGACGSGWQSAIHPEDVERVQAGWHSLLECGSAGEVEARLRRFDGTFRWFLMRAVPLRDDAGCIVKWYGQNIDIEDRKQAEIERAQHIEALKRSETFLAEAQRVSRTGSFSWRIESNEIIWSEQVYRLFEIDPATPLQLDLITSRVHPDDAAVMQDMMARVQAGKDFEYEHRLLMPDGRVKYTHVVAQAVRDAQGRLEYIGASQDVTERRLYEETLDKVRSELAHVARVSSLGALTASIAHEVNQPLAGIITNASTCLRMLAAESPHLDGARDTARRTIRDAKRASEVIARLRALFTKKPITSESMDLNDAVKEVIALSLHELQRSRVVLRTELAEGVLAVVGDRVQLQQVILNLLLNALDAMSAIEDGPRQLVIRTDRDREERVRFSVQDSGVGLDPQNVGRLFDAFYTTKAGGMGIGLSVSRTIIESHNGSLWATANDGPGATFVFSLPCASRQVGEFATSEQGAVAAEV